MFTVSSLNEKCTGCGEEELIWWQKDETEHHIEAYMGCNNCNYYYPKEIIQKSEDTSDAAIKKKLKQKL